MNSLAEIRQNLENTIYEAIEVLYGKKPTGEIKITTPPEIDLGDFAVECFSLAKQLQKSPADIAKEIATELQKNNDTEFNATGPYLNVKINNQKLFSLICQNEITASAKNGQTVMIEYLSPNTNKPLHLGHIRNGVIGMATSSILDFTGNKVIRSMVINDRGIHISKSMLAWKKYASSATPESVGKKGDHFVGDYYVLFANKLSENPALMDEAQAMLKKWEEGDSETLEIWNKMNTWVYAGFEETFKLLGFVFDAKYYESKIYKDGRDIIQAGIDKGIFKKNLDGATYFDLPEKEFGLNKDKSEKKLTLLRGDGTSIYITQDIALAIQKATDYSLDASVYVVGSEQEYYFKTLFAVLKKLGYPWANKCHHLSYGMVDLPSGKMKSREGTVVDADDLAKEVIELAKQEIEIKSAGKIPETEIKERARKIGLGAIKFYLLRANPKNKITFNPKESISFDGITGPYVQYAYTRAMNILEEGKKAGLTPDYENFNSLGNNPEERLLAQKLIFFSENIEKSATTYNPSILADAVYELAKNFHQFYGKHRVVIEDKKLAIERLALVEITAKTIKTGLELLGIETLEKM